MKMTHYNSKRYYQMRKTKIFDREIKKEKESMCNYPRNIS
jgi:hypothetical protein